MHDSTQIKPISHLKNHAAQVLAHITTDREPLVITQNGEARAVLQEMATYEEAQDTLAMLMLLALGIQDYRQVFFKPYRLIYRLHGKPVVVYLIADGRRDMPALLARRLLGHSVS